MADLGPLFLGKSQLEHLVVNPGTELQSPVDTLLVAQNSAITSGLRDNFLILPIHRCFFSKFLQPI